MAIRARFKGATHSPRPGEPEEPIEYLQGIPARDLTDEEFAALPAEFQDQVSQSGLYEVVQQSPAADQPVAEAAPPTEPLAGQPAEGATAPEGTG